MTNSYRWAWFALACVTAAAWLWTQRYQYIECDRDGYDVCIVANRWSGRIGIVPTTKGWDTFTEGRHGPDSAAVVRRFRALGP